MSFDPEEFLGALAQFAHRLLTPYDIDETLDDLARSVTRELDLTGTAVNLSRDGRLEYATALPPELQALEQVQMDTQSGPCVDAFRSGSAVVVEDLGQEDARWPAYRTEAARRGVAAVAGIPMLFPDRPVGAVGLYSRAPRAWTEGDVTAATVLADMATAYLVNASKIAQKEQVTEQLQRALDSRLVIEQAKGVVANSHGIGVQQAFDLIQRYARGHHTSVRAVAEAVVNLDLKI
jgi:GAF domain-containing protein